MKQKKLTKIFMMILKLKKPFVYKGLYKNMSALQGLNQTIY